MFSAVPYLIIIGVLIVACIVFVVLNERQLRQRNDQDILILSLQKENRRLDKEVRKYERIQAQKSVNLQKRLAKKKAEADATSQD